MHVEVQVQTCGTGSPTGLKSQLLHQSPFTSSLYCGQHREDVQRMTMAGKTPIKNRIFNDKSEQTARDKTSLFMVIQHTSFLV